MLESEAGRARRQGEEDRITHMTAEYVEKSDRVPKSSTPEPRPARTGVPFMDASDTNWIEFPSGGSDAERSPDKTLELLRPIAPLP